MLSLFTRNLLVLKLNRLLSADTGVETDDKESAAAERVGV